MKKIHLPAGTEHVQFDELAQLIANALRPLGDDATDSEMMAHAGTRVNLEAELNQAVKDCTLPVKDPLTFGPHTFPVGDALRRSLVTVGDLRAFLAGRPVTLEIAPEQAATPKAATDADLMTYRAREQFTLFELACLLHRADPEKVHNDTWDGWRERKRQLGFERAEMTPALFIGELSLMPELLAGPLIGGTIKQLKKAIGCATILHSIEGNQARTLADCLGLTFPPELSAAQAQQAPEPQAAPVVAESASGGDEWKAKARARAVEIIERQRKRDLYPPLIDVADEIAREFRAGGVMGASGKPLTGSYIKRHALKGISSAQGKRVSTSIRRGK